MKVYLVVADNGQHYDLHRRWNVGVFASEEAALKRIDEIPKEVYAADSRLDELEELFYMGEGGSIEERLEYEHLMNISNQYWHFFDNGRFIIEEYEVID